MTGGSYPPWVGIVVALGIGALVRVLRLPIPAPPTVVGAAMVLATTVGYLLMNWFLKR